MKKTLLIIGLLLSLVSFSQADKWVISGVFVSDCTISYPNPKATWLGSKVSVMVQFKYPEDPTGILSIGGTDEEVAAYTGYPDFSYYEAWDNNPLTVDTTGTVMKQFGSSPWWKVGFSYTTGWPYKDCAISWDANTCDSVYYYIIFRLSK